MQDEICQTETGLPKAISATSAFSWSKSDLLKAQPQGPKKGRGKGNTTTDADEYGKCLTQQKEQLHQQKYISIQH